VQVFASGGICLHQFSPSFHFAFTFLLESWETSTHTSFLRRAPKRSLNPSVSEWVDGMQSALRNAKSNISSAQQRQKAYADKRRRDHSFQIGDQVLLAARQNQLPLGLSSKLSAKYFGPFTIVGTAGTHAFKLLLPDSVNIHPVFHVSQLKPYVPSSLSTETTHPGPVFADRGGKHYEVEDILAKKKINRTWHFLVKWKGYPDSDNNWEPLKNVKHLRDLIAAAPLIS
jgi:hypothetical protein